MALAKKVAKIVVKGVVRRGKVPGEAALTPR